MTRQASQRLLKYLLVWGTWLWFLGTPQSESVAQVITLTGGTSALLNVQGGSIAFQNSRCKSTLGAGRISGSFTYGATLRCSMEDYRFTVGDNPIQINLPTDIFTGGYYFLSRGMRVDTKVKKMFV